MRFRKNPVEFEAVQWTGDNLEEMQAFCGGRETGDAYLHNFFINEGVARLWVAANKQCLDLEVGEWVIQDKLGFYPCKDEIIKANNTVLDDETLAFLRQQEEPKTFEQELESLINRHSKENDSGTPDFILASFLSGCLDTFNVTVQARANWRSESVELPALEAIKKVPKPTKRVPLVRYDNGERNEIGEAEVEIWPGEVRVEGVLTNLQGVIPLLDGMSVAPPPHPRPYGVL